MILIMLLPEGRLGLGSWGVIYKTCGNVGRALGGWLKRGRIHELSLVSCVLYFVWRGGGGV